MTSDRLPDDVVRRIHSMRAQLYSADYIAGQLSLPAEVVRRVIGESKASPHKPHSEPNEQERWILRLRAEGWSHKRIAREVGCVKSTVQRTLARHGDPLPQNAGPSGSQTHRPRRDSAGEAMRVPGSRLGTPIKPVLPTPTGESKEWEEREDTATLRGDTAKSIRTEEDVYRAFEVDRTRWRIKTWKVKAWEVMAKVGNEASGYYLETRQMYGVTANLERILKRDVERALDLVFERFRDVAPVWPKVVNSTRQDEPFLAVMGLMDAHFGKYSWEGETGENYDLKIAETIFANAVEDLLAESKHRNVTRFVVPLGNDFLHFDSRSFQTTRGTPQDVDGRFSKVLATAKMAAISAVERMAAVAPVQVELVSGNHDRSLSECLCHMIDARFHHTDRVTVNASPKTRKYVRFGTNLIGLTHGDMVKAEKLPGLMAAESKREWADTTCHEWIIGHGHRSQKWVTKDTDTQQGTVVRMLRALTNTDLWHFDSGFISPNLPAAEVYFYGRDRGYAGHAIVPVRGG